MALAELLIAMGWLIIAVAVAIAIGTWVSQGSKVSKKYDIFEMTLLTELAKKKGFDLSLEEAREAITSEKSFKKRIQEELLKTFIAEQDKKKEGGK